MLKRDSWFLGIAIGLVLPFASYFILDYGIQLISKLMIGKAIQFTVGTLQVISIFTNVLPFRYYMINLKFDYTGRGILLVTFIMGIAYFIKYLD